MNGVKLDFRSEVKKVEKELSKNALRNRKKAAQELQRRLKAADIPVDTGNLKNSLDKVNGRINSFVGFKAPHARLVENGHELIIKGVKRGRVEGRPFFRPVWNMSIDDLKRILGEPL